LCPPIFVPVYNEQEAVKDFITELEKAIKKIDILSECIIVDDNSNDGTPKFLKTADVILITHNTTLGYGASIKSGVDKAKGDFICIIDGDNTYSPSDIPKLVQFIGKYDMIVGARIKDAAWHFPFHQKIAKGLVCSLLKVIFKQKILDVNSGFRLIKKSIVEKYSSILPNAFSFTSSITLAMLLDGHKIKYVPIRYSKRRGRSKVKVFSYTINFIKSYWRIVYQLRFRRRYGPANGMAREQRDRALFDRTAKKWARKESTISISVVRKEGLLSAIKPVLDESPNLGTVVDIGCGIGSPAKYLADFYECYIGIDQSEKMIEEAMRFNRYNPKATFLVRNSKSRDLPQGVADLILLVGALHHMTELEDVMDSLVRIAKPGAFLVAIEPQGKNPLIQMIRWMNGIWDPSYSREQVYFSEKDLRGLFARHGVMVYSVEQRGFFAPIFAHRAVYPQALGALISRSAIAFDRWLDAHLPAPLKRHSAHIIITGRCLK